MSNMDVFFKTRLSANDCSYKSSLERIIDKYSKLQYQDGGVEVDLDTTKPRTLERYMVWSKAELSKLESKSLTDLREESIRAQDLTRDSQLDSTYGDADETCASTGQMSAEETGMSTIDSTGLTVRSSEESLRNLSETEVQPEDRDEELEMSLRSHGSSLVELYPGMIGRLGRAWRRQHVSEAAGSVLRRYRRWRRRRRRQPGRSHLGITFVGGNHENETSRTLEEEEEEEEEEMTRSSPAKRPLTGAETSPRSPWRTRSDRHRPVLVMDFSEPCETVTPRESSVNETFTETFTPRESSVNETFTETFTPRESSVNETFTVYEASRLGEQPPACTFSPSRPRHPAADPSSRSRRLSLTAHSLQADLCSAYETVRERPDVYGSLARRSPSSARVTSSLGRSPHGFPRSPKTYSGESFSREPSRPRLISTPPHKPAAPLRMLHLQDAHHPHQLRSPQAAVAGGGRPHGLRRHLSFDSSLPSISYSPKKLDEDFLKLYHKFVCQSKSPFFNGHPCRLCARSSEAGRGPSSSSSSSSLAALALSPHRSLLRKRHRELDWDGHPESKRYRDERCPSSPGSRRHGKEMLRRRLSPSECGLSYSCRTPGVFERFNPHQDAWTSRRGHVSADFSGSSLASRGFSPRKW